MNNEPRYDGQARGTRVLVGDAAARRRWLINYKVL